MSGLSVSPKTLIEHLQTSWTSLPDVLRAVLVFAVLPNLLFLALGQVISLEAHFVNYDYLLLAAFALLAGRTWGAAALGPVLISDLLVRAGPVFHLTVPELLTSFQELVRIDPVIVGTVSLLVLTTVGVLALASWRLLDGLKCEPRVAGGLGAVGVLVVAVSTWMWHPYVNENHELIVPDPKVTSSSKQFTEGLLRINTYRDNPPSKIGIPSATDTLFTALEEEEALPDKVVLVVAEGMGLFTKDPDYPSLNHLKRQGEHDRAEKLANQLFEGELVQLMLEPLQSPRLKERYHIETGIIPKVGGTVEAEIRELCQAQVRTKYPNPAYLPRRKCLPHLLKERGYRTTGVHGNSGQVFSRHVWWKGLGLEQRLFTDQIRRITGRDRSCPPSVWKSARCDVDALEAIRERVLERPGKDFVHWLTLNAHQPVQQPDTTLTELRCSDQPFLQRENRLCRELQFQHIVTSLLAETATDPDLPDTAIILVGDHAVGFSMDHEKRFTRRGFVPYVVLWPKSG